MKTIIAALSLMSVCAGLASPGWCAVRTASFQVSFTVVDACRVDAGNWAPTVSCQMSSTAAVTPTAAVDGSPAWVVTF